MASYGPHHGEEGVLSGWRGSGTIFFSRCNLKCQICQNHDISQSDIGRDVTPEDLASIMLELEARGCHNINFVSPSHVTPQIMQAVLMAAKGGLSLPLVYNTGGYDSVATLGWLDGIIDIYMPDMKYGDSEVAERISRIPNYAQANRAAVSEMHRQVGDLHTDKKGIALRGLIIRHLVLPHHLAGTDRIVRFLAAEISSRTYLNIMDQYYPAYPVSDFPDLGRRITPQEYQEALDAAQNAGLTRLDPRAGFG